MPRKKTSSRILQPDISLRIAVIAVGSFLVIALSVTLLIARDQAKNFCANSISCITDLTGHKEAQNEGIYMGRRVVAPQEHQYALGELRAVLGHTTTNNKRIHIDLSKQRLYAYEGTTLIYDFPVSTGKWNPTPTGDFRIWIWLRYTRMSGGTGADYYNLPNVPYTMYFYNDSTPKYWGYGIHGAYWHNNFGHPMSHGCVNMKIEDAGKIFYWTNSEVKGVVHASNDHPGTPITIYGTTPKE